LLALFSTGYGSPVNAASPAVKAVLSRISASAGMISPARTRRMSPGTILSTSMSRNDPSRLTSALIATDRRRTSAALTAWPSWIVSSPMDSPRIATMIDPPMPSPVTTETTPAASKISESGSSNRRKIARSRLSAFASVSLLGPYRTSRRSASSELNPSVPQ
jgi:hypothetical protein